MATVYIPTHLRKLIDGRSQIEVAAETVQGIFEALVAAYPRARSALVRPRDGDEGGGAIEISRFIGVFVDGRDYRDLGGGACKLSGTERIDLLLPMAGG